MPFTYLLKGEGDPTTLRRCRSYMLSIGINRKRELPSGTKCDGQVDVKKVEKQE